MSDFMLIDLATQYDEVLRYVTAMTPEKMLEWMSRFGEVKKLAHTMDDSLYVFQSPSGIRTVFRIHESGRLIVFE